MGLFDDGEGDCMMYESPITQMVSDITSQMIKNQEDQFMYEIQQKIGYNIDKDELIKALNYDREQYDKGYLDGLKAKQELLELIQDVNPEEISAQIARGNLHNWCLILKREFNRLLNAE